MFIDMTEKLALLGGEPLRTLPFPEWPVFDDSERARIDRGSRKRTLGGRRSEGTGVLGKIRRILRSPSRHLCFQRIGIAGIDSEGRSALGPAMKLSCLP